MRNLKILSLDGGGVRGLSSLLLLQDIFGKFKTRLRQPELKPCDYFDIIGGTSTGGIIALMLGRLRMDIDECIAKYEALGRQVFGKSQTFKEYRYDKGDLEREIKKVVKEKTGDENSRLWEPSGCKTVVFTISKNHVRGEPDALRSWPSRHHYSKEIKIWEAARATSAAPTYLEPIRLNLNGVELTYIDAGLGTNNPTQALLTEAEKEWGGFEEDYYHHEQIGLLLSLGTGFRDIKRGENRTVFQKITAKIGKPHAFIPVLLDYVNDTQSTHQAMQGYNIKGYFRFNVEQGLQAVEFFEYKRQSDIAADTSEYIRSRWREIETCAKHAGWIDASGSESHLLGVGQSHDSRRSRSASRSTTPVPSLFLELDKRSTYMKSKSEGEDPYWSRITAGGLAMYERIFDLMPQNCGYISYASFSNYFEPLGLRPAKLKHFWCRLGLEGKWAPKNYALALICMLHFESDYCFPNMQPRSRRSAILLSGSREMVIKRFCNWIVCCCGQLTGVDSCGLQWTFPGEAKGTCRGLSGFKCLAFMNFQGNSLHGEQLEGARQIARWNLNAWLNTTAQEPCHTMSNGETAE